MTLENFAFHAAVFVVAIVVMAVAIGSVRLYTEWMNQRARDRWYKIVRRLDDAR